VEVAQVAEHGLIFFAHAASEVGIVEALVASALGHILQDSQALLDGLPAIRRELLPFRHHVIADVLALIGSHALPDLFALAHVLPLLGRHAVPILGALANLGLLLRRQVVETLIVLEKAFALLRRHLAEAIHHGMLAIWRNIAAKIARGILSRHRPPVIFTLRRSPVIFTGPRLPLDFTRRRSPLAGRQGLRRTILANGWRASLGPRAVFRRPVGALAALLPFLLPLLALLPFRLPLLFFGLTRLVLRGTVLPIIALALGCCGKNDCDAEHEPQ